MAESFTIAKFISSGHILLWAAATPSLIAGKCVRREKGISYSPKERSTNSTRTQQTAFFSPQR
jgi:hypothetical protein